MLLNHEESSSRRCPRPRSMGRFSLLKVLRSVRMGRKLVCSSFFGSLELSMIACANAQHVCGCGVGSRAEPHLAEPTLCYEPNMNHPTKEGTRFRIRLKSSPNNTRNRGLPTICLPPREMLQLQRS